MRSHIVRWPRRPVNPRRCAPARAWQSMPVQRTTLWMARRPIMRGMFGWDTRDARVEEAHCCGAARTRGNSHVNTHIFSPLTAFS
jgi:hypothetical protein